MPLHESSQGSEAKKRYVTEFFLAFPSPAQEILLSIQRVLAARFHLLPPAGSLLPILFIFLELLVWPYECPWSLLFVAGLSYPYTRLPVL
jgi:hypothetical protein